MQPGKLRFMVEIQKPNYVKTQEFETSMNWVKFACAWADIRAITGREWYQSQQAKANISHIVKIRFMPGITPRHRVLWGDRILNITQVVPDSTGSKWVVLRCEEDVGHV
jgi:SPP1 family predicted phage head-tail adaptor